MKRIAGIAAGMALAITAACAVRLGGPAPVEYRTLSIAAAPGEPVSAVAARIMEAEPDLVLLSAPHDSAWFGSIAEATGLELSGPSRTSGSGLAFLTRRVELLGDTSIVMGAAGGSRIHMHDALYEIDERRLIDLMIVRADPVVDVSSVVRTLLSYEASDVMATATIVLGVEAADAAVADSIALRLRAAFENAAECAGDSGADRPAVRLLYRPPARIRCSGASVLESYGRPIVATLVVGRF